MDEDGGSHVDDQYQPTEELDEDGGYPYFISKLFLCATLFVLGYLFYEKGWPALIEWRRKREEDKEAEMYKKNPDLLLAREMALENARKKLQEKYASQSQEYAEKQRLKEEQKAQEKIAAYEAQQRGEGGKSLRSYDSVEPVSKLEKRKSAFRPEYNPLLGDGGSCGYRPSRRSGRSGG